jgi:hypothetical protein
MASSNPTWKTCENSGGNDLARRLFSVKIAWRNLRNPAESEDNSGTECMGNS